MPKKINVESTISKKNKKAENANILNMECYIDDDNTVYLEFMIDQMIEPYMRQRDGRGHMYDPLSKYKKIIKNKIIDALKEKNIEIEISEDVYICEDITVGIEIPKSYPIKKQVLAYQQEYHNNKKPDTDNINKTLRDILEGVIFFNDSQICKCNIEKIYDSTEYTNIRYEIHQQPDTTGRADYKMKEIYKIIQEDRRTNENE